MKRNFILCVILLATLSLQAQNKGRGDTTEVELITFETESIFFRQGTPTTNIWEIGQPSKNIFAEAYSAPNAIVTNKLNAYPTNNHSWFDIVLTNENFWYLDYNFGVSFYHKLNTDFQNDGGFISVSYNNGLNWQNILYDTLYNPFFHNITPANGDNWFNANLYTLNDKLFNGEIGFSGSINEWEKVEIYWESTPVKKSAQLGDSLIIRFNFISDSVENNLDGWMIDNIRIYWIDIGGKIHEQPISNLVIIPNPVYEHAIIKSKDKSPITCISIYNLSGQLIKTMEFNKPEILIEMGNISPGTYFVECQLNNNQTETLKIIFMP